MEFKKLRESLPLPSDRSFGLTFATIFALVAGWSAWKSGSHWPYFLGIAGLFAAIALVRPRLLRPLNVAWMAFAAILNRVVSPIALGIIYFVLFAPVSLFFKLRGRDLMNRKFNPAATTYWQERTPPGPDAQSSFPRQF